MRTEDGIIYLKENELAKILFALCRPNEYADRCQYNGKGNDFENCEAYQIISAVFPEYKERGDGWKKFLILQQKKTRKNIPATSHYVL